MAKYIIIITMDSYDLLKPFPVYVHRYICNLKIHTQYVFLDYKTLNLYRMDIFNTVFKLFQMFPILEKNILNKNCTFFFLKQNIIQIYFLYVFY